MGTASTVRRVCVAGLGAASAVAMSVPVAVAPAAATPPRDEPVAACPSGAAPAALRVARDPAGTWRLGAFEVRLSAEGLRVAADGRTLWSSARDGFVAAGAGEPGIVDGGGGFYRVRGRLAACWRRQSVTAATRHGSTLSLRGRLSGARRRSLGYTAELEPVTAHRMGLTVRLRGAGADAIVLSGASTSDEAVHGFGVQTRWN